ncbi:MAG: hypothetical protein ABI453_17510 [Isosphaeraceae bacterium]
MPTEPGPNDRETAWHQVAELPKLAAIVTEHQAQTRTCPNCGLVNHATIPAEVRAHVIDPRLTATMGYLSGRFHLSKRPRRRVRRGGLRRPGVAGHRGAALGAADQRRAWPWRTTKSATRCVRPR